MNFSWNYLDDLQMALLAPLDPENEIPVRFLAAVNENHTDNPKSINLVGKAKYRLGEFAAWYKDLPNDSPIKNGQELIAAISAFQLDPSAENRQKLQAQIESQKQKAIATLHRNVWGSHWGKYFDQVAWMHEAMRVLEGKESIDDLQSPNHQWHKIPWPDVDVDLIDVGQRLGELPRKGKQFIKEGKLDEAIRAYQDLTLIPGMTPDRQLLNLYARQSEWELALRTARQIPGDVDWRLPLLLAQLGQASEGEIAATAVLTNTKRRNDPSYAYRHARVASLFDANTETREAIQQLVKANSPPKTTIKWRCALVAPMVYRLGEFNEWYESLPLQSPYRYKTELLAALSAFQRDASANNQAALERAISVSEKRIQKLVQSGDLGDNWSEHVCQVVMIREAREALRGESVK